jgi:hypothetical protein
VTRERIRELLGLGVACFIDLTYPHELGCYDDKLPAGIRYLRSSIADFDIPRERFQMEQILDCIHGVLRERGAVYVHCRAGIGRTGTVVGCWLAEQGVPGAPALAELNRLWKQSGRSLLCPEIPPARDQADFVRSWIPRRLRGP